MRAAALFLFFVMGSASASSPVSSSWPSSKGSENARARVSCASSAAASGLSSSS